jgi:tetratricopeptide (TPR) repeat protein
VLLGTVTVERFYARVTKKQFSLLVMPLCALFFLVIFFHGNVKEYRKTYDESREIKNITGGYGKEALRLEKSGKLEEAINVYHIILQNNPGLYDAHYNMGVVLLKQGKNEEALKKFIHASKIDPTSSASYSNIGNIYAMNKDYEKAITYYEKAIFYDPNDPVFYNNLGAMYMLSGSNEDAITNFKKAIELNPHYESPKKNLQKLLGVH